MGHTLFVKQGCDYKRSDAIIYDQTGETCPECGSPLVERKSKHGKFISCSDYKNCDYKTIETKTRKKRKPHKVAFLLITCIDLVCYNTSMQKVNIIGAGLAGVEAALYLANRGISVDLLKCVPRKIHLLIKHVFCRTSMFKFS